MRHIGVSKFRAEVLSLLDEIAQTGEEIVITKRGRPLAHVRPARKATSLRGSIEYLVSDDELTEPIGQPWDADRR